MRVFDCFTFHNEVDLLSLRVRMLAPHVDHFVIVEATKTHTGKPREPIVAAQIVGPAAARCTVVVVDDMPDSGDAWARENHQRRSIRNGLRVAGAAIDDLIIVTDADEIVDPAVIDLLRAAPPDEAVALSMRWMQFRVNLEVDRPWPLARVTRFSEDFDAQLLRESVPPQTIRRAGWHFSYLGRNDAVATKLGDFAHVEMRGVYDSLSHITRCQRLHVDLLGRFRMQVRPRSVLPDEVVRLLSRRPELEATPLSLRDRAASWAYLRATPYRRRLSPSRMDKHVVIATCAGVGLYLSQVSLRWIRRTAQFLRLHRSIPRSTAATDATGGFHRER